MGAQSDQLTIGVDNPYQYQEGRSLGIDPAAAAPVKFFKLAKGFLDIRQRYNVFHFNFGSTLLHAPRFGLNLADLPHYPRSAAIFATYNGCDARQKMPTMASRPIAACHDPKCYGGQCNSGVLDRRRRAAIDKMARHAHYMWALNPDLLRFLPQDKSSFLPYAISVGKLEPELPTVDGPLRIAHAPSDRAAKGTAHLIAAVAALQARYPGGCELELIEGLPHAQALERIRACHVLADQLLIGWYGGVAVEAMMLGKAVIARIEHDDAARIRPDMASELSGAILQAGPADLYAVLERCILDRNAVIESARRAVAYAYRWHAPEKVAAQTLAAYGKVQGELQCAG